ncbi:MAG: NADP-dependent oxidoreductase [Bacteroidetes bacterium]|nr:NADP-dependent oxidoreductase [Bacteroidota bacterium]
MKAIILKDFGTVDNLQPADIPLPIIKDEDVLIQVKAFSINPIDVKTRAGKGVAVRLKEFSPMILGWDIAGVITATGKSVTNFKQGDAVFGMINFPGIASAYSEYVSAPATHIAIKPKNISFEEAAASTLAALTAWEAVVDVLKIQKGDRLLVHAAAGGVGHFAVQIAKYFGAYVIGTTSATNKTFVLGIGADEHIDYHTQPLDKATGNIDKVLDTIGGNNIDQSLKVMRKGGIIVSIPSGRNEEVAAKAEAAGMFGYRMLVQSSGENQQQIAKLIETGFIKPHISKIYSFDQIQEAHLQIESGRTVGKIVVQV